MGICFLHGNSGAGISGGLNFNVVGGTSQPTRASHNTVWINTATAITGWVFAAQAPESPVQGLAFIQAGTESPAPINLSEDNFLMIYPMAAQQYIDGAWADMEAEIYDGVTWTAFSESATYLYRPGDTCDALTGGWVSHKFSAGSGSVAVSEEIKSTEAGMTIKLEYSTGISSSTFIGTEDKISTADYSKLHMEFSEASVSVAGAGAVQVCLFSDEGYIKAASADILSTGGSLNLSAEIDVSELSGEYYIGFLMWKWNKACVVTARMTSAMLTK